MLVLYTCASDLTKQLTLKIHNKNEHFKAVKPSYLILNLPSAIQIFLVSN